MKRFNLEEYLKNPSKKVVTRTGRKVRIVCTDAKGAYPVIALLTTKAGYEEVESCYVYNDKGELGRIDTDLDLFFAPEKHEGWINMYKTNCVGTEVFNTPDSAKEYGMRHVNYVATIKIEWEE